LETAKIKRFLLSKQNYGNNIPLNESVYRLLLSADKTISALTAKKQYSNTLNKI
jgi:hypothetical protein